MITMKMSSRSDDDNANNTNDDEFNSDDMDNNVEVNDDKNAKSTTHTG